MKQLFKYAMFIVIALTTIANLCSCSKNNDDDSINVTSSKSLTLHHNETSQIVCNAENANYSSDNEFVATVSTKGLVKANFVGETNIAINGQKLVKVSVAPKYLDFVEPVYEFGISKAQVKSKEGTSPIREDDTSIFFNGKGKEDFTMYIFDDYGKLKSSSMLVKTSYSSRLADFLLERYMTVDVNSSYSTGSYLTLSANGIDEKTITMGIGTSLYNSSYMMVIYFPVNLTKTRGNDKYLDEEIKDAWNKFLSR